MPTYQYRCKNCGTEMEVVSRMKDHKNRYPCSNCDNEAEQIITQAPVTVIPAMMRWDFNGYESPIDGRVIRNKRERADDLARNGCVEYDPEMKTDYQRRVKADDARLDKLVDETVEREILAMPAPKRENLEAELSRGAAADITRL